MKFIKNNSEYWLFKYLWLIMIMPKYIQMAILSLILVAIIIKNKNKIFVNNITRIFTGFFMVNVISICINSAAVDYDDRILAACNTACLWLLGGIFYALYKSLDVEKEKIKKYMTVNMYILIVLGIIMLVCKTLKLPSPTLMSNTLFRTDWQNSYKTIRFKGFLEYPNLGIFLYMLCFPFFCEHVQERKSIIAKVILILVSTISPILTNSRMGIFAVIIACLAELLKVFDKYKKKLLINTLIVCLVVFFAGLNFQGLYNKAYKIVNSRDASTSTRTNIYQKSIEHVVDGSLLFGCGIKQMIGNYPLGSHSTYIGIFYKTGLIGFMIFLVGYVSMIFELYKNTSEKKKIIQHFIPIMLLVVMFALEDLDGCNWLTILFFSVVGLFSRKNTGKEEIKDEQNKGVCE